MNIDINTTAVQQVTSDELDVLAKNLCGVRLALSDTGIPSFPVDSVTTTGLTATSSDGVYLDTRLALASKGITLTNTESYKLRILDPYVKSVLLGLNIGSNSTITQPDAATAVFGNAFQNNTDITEFDEYKYFTTQSSSSPSFKNCTNLVSIDLTGMSGTPIFEGCSNLEYFHGRNSEAGTLDLGTRTGLPSGGAFRSCPKLRKVIIRNPISTGSNVFLQTNNLTQVMVYGGLNTYLQCNFGSSSGPLKASGCSLTDENGTLIDSVTFPVGTQTIQAELFKEYGKLANVTIPESVTTIQSDAFKNCNIQRVDIEDLTSWINISFGNSGANPARRSLHLYVNGVEPTEVLPYGSTVNNTTQHVFPQDITTIKRDALGGISSLVHVTIPNTVTQIDSALFSDCRNLQSVDFQQNSQLTNIGAYMFERCYALTSLVMPSTVTTIGDSAFVDCTGLTNITLPNSVTSIGKAAFGNCTNLQSISIPNSVTSIGSQAFQNCTGLTSITMPTNITQIGENAFSGCSGLTGDIDVYGTVTGISNGAFGSIGSRSNGVVNVNIHEGVTSIGRQIFSGAKITGTITIPSTVQTIDYDFLIRVSGNPIVKFLGSVPPQPLDSSKPWWYLQRTSKVMVPQGSLSAYQNVIRQQMSEQDFNSVVFEEYT